MDSGPRGCTGKAMAYAEMTSVLAAMVWLYEMCFHHAEHTASLQA